MGVDDPTRRCANSGRYANANPIHRLTLGRFFDRLVEELKTLDPRTVVDVGCGEGLFLAEIERRGIRFADYLGIDVRDDALTIARSLHPDRRFTQADVLEWSSLSLP